MVGRNLPFFQQITEGRWATVRTAIPDSRSGLILGDFVSSRISRHEGRGAGKIDPPGGHRLVSRKENLREKIVTGMVNPRPERVVEQSNHLGRRACSDVAEEQRLS